MHQLVLNPPWFSRALEPSYTALVVIDMQEDFCATDGWVVQLGVGVENTRRPIEPIRRVLSTMRLCGFHVFHTREGHRPDLADLNRNKQWRTRCQGLGIGDAGRHGRVLVRGEPGWAIIPELAPLVGEPVVDKPGKGAFFATDLDHLLRTRGVKNLVITGVTTDCCVQSTMRDAVDLGYECVLLEDCCDAIRHSDHVDTIRIFRDAGGAMGWVSDSQTLLALMQ